MKKVLIISVIFQLFCLGIAQAHPDDYIVLKSGKIVQGYISSQIPGQRITLMSDNDDTPGFDIDSVAFIEQAARDNELIVGIVDVIETSRGPIKGQIIKRTLLERRSIVILKDNGETEDILNSEIKVQKKEKLNPNFPLFSQSEFLDIVVTKDGEFTGIITKQDFTGSPTLFLEKENGDQQKFVVSNISELRRKLNKQYSPKKTFHPEPGSYYFNETPVNGVKTLKWKKDWIALDDNDVKEAQVINLKDGILTIATDDNAVNRKLMLLEVQQVAAGKISKYAYSLVDADKGGIPYNTTNQDGKEAVWTYTLQEGYYVLLIPDSDLVYVVNIAN